METMPAERRYREKASKPFKQLEFKLEAIGEPNREVNYGYVLLGLRKH
jgi:hypothetical protein